MPKGESIARLGAFYISAAPTGASFFRAAVKMVASFGFQNQPPLSRRRAPSTTAGGKLLAKSTTSRIFRWQGWRLILAP